MKPKFLISTLFASFLLIANLSAQNPTFEWARQMGGKSYDFANHITTDIQGNIYTTGPFVDTADFDPGPGITNLISASIGYSDIFIQKLDVNGNLLWAKQMGGTYNDNAHCIASDSQGNVYTTGNFIETVDFDPGIGITNLTSEGNSDIFIQKLDADGNFIWVKQMGGIYDDTGYSITIDADGDIITTGDFQNTIDFDPGSGIANLTSEGKLDVFIQKLDANGNFLWAKSMGGIYDDRGYAVTTDTDGNVYTTGFFKKSVDFDPGEGTFNLQAYWDEDIFIQKLDTDGNFIWAKSMGGEGKDVSHSIAIDSHGNIYTTGIFHDTVDFDPGSDETNLTSAGEEDIFLQKLDPNGDLLWVKQMGGLGSDAGNRVAIDAEDNIYTAGSFNNTVDFNSGVGESNLTSNGSYDIFIQKNDADGNFQWVRQMGGIGEDYLYGLAIDATGNIYSTGTFSYTVDFDPGSGNTSFTADMFDIFIQKMSQSPVGILENTFSKNFVVYPNPTDGKFSIEFDNIQEALTVSLYALTGQLIMNKIFKNTNIIELQLSQANGIYLLEIIDNTGKKAVLRILKE